MPTSPLDYARSMLGKREDINGADVHQYLQTGGAGMDPATAAWCAAFVNASLGHAGITGTGSNMARSFLNYGQPETGQPQPGDIAVYPRGGVNSPYGHVGFVENFDPNTKMITMLAGNQGNAVSERQFPLSGALGVRRVGDSAYSTGGQSAPLANPSSPSYLDTFSPRLPAAPAPTIGEDGAPNVLPQQANKTWLDYLMPQPNVNQIANTDPWSRLFAGQNPFGDNPLRPMIYNAIHSMFS